MRRTWGVPVGLLVLASCSFLDDFDRFQIAANDDAGLGADASRDAEVTDAGEPDPGSDDAGNLSPVDGSAADAMSEPPDAGVTTDGDAAQAPADAGSVPDASVPIGCGTTGTEPPLRCYPDLDGDRFADLTKPAVLACRCGSDALAVADPDAAQADCWDDPDTRGADAHPGQTAYFDRGYGPGGNLYDYDCDDAVEQERGVYRNDCAGLLGLACSSGEGFGALTGCGIRAAYVSCTMQSLTACQARTDERTQACH